MSCPRAFFCGPKQPKSFLLCISLLTTLFILVDATLDIIFLIKNASDSPDFLFLCLILIAILNAVNLFISLSIVFYFFKKTYKLKFFKTLGGLLIAKTTLKLIFLLYYVLKGKLRLIIKYNIISQYLYEFFYFVISFVLFIPFVWLALLYICKLKLVKNYYFPTSEVVMTNNWYRDTEPELPSANNNYITSQNRPAGLNDTREGSDIKFSGRIIATSPQQAIN